MQQRVWVLRLVLCLISLPVLVVLVDAVSFKVANRTNGSFVSDGRTREYLLHVPRSYDRARPTPLVISLHGAGGWPAQQMQLSRWNRLADAQGFIVVYPSAAQGAGPRVWHVERGAGLMGDVRFIAALIDTLEAAYSIDPTQVYANGVSNGGGMTFALSCTLSDRIAAFGLVAAAQTLEWDWCTDLRPAPMVAFHGTADPEIPYNGGSSWMAPDTFPSVLAWTRSWSRRNRCAPHPVDSAVAPGVTRRSYTGCADQASVVLYTLAGGGHTWPGGERMPEWFVGRTSRGIDATRLMWEFFRAHPLSRVPDRPP